MTAHHPGEQDWLPRADMAALMRKSEDTVRRIVEKDATRDGDAGRVLVSVADFLRLGHLRHEDIVAGNRRDRSRSGHR
jgi:hypothetical protein